MAASNPPDVMAYLAPSNVSIYDHLAQVLATVHVGDIKDAKANFHKISREVLETTMAWRDEAPPSKSDMTSQQASRDLFRTTKAAADPVSAVLGHRERELDTYVPDIMGEANLLNWSGVSLGEAEVCKVMLSIRELAKSHPEFKSVRFFGKILARNSDYFVAECEMTGIDELPPTGLPPNHIGRRNIEKVLHHNKIKYYVTSYPGAPWTALPNVRWDQLQAVPAVRKLLTGDLKAPFASYPPFPGDTEAQYLRARIAFLAHHTVLSPLGYFKEAPVDLEALPPQPDNGIVFSGEWMPPESASELEGLLKIEAWQKHYPSIDIFDDPEMVKTEDGKWEPEAFEPEAYPLRDCAADVEAEAAGHPNWVGRVCSQQNRACSPIVMRSVRFPGAVVVAHGPRFVCFYHGWGDEYKRQLVTCKLTPQLVCPLIQADNKYRVLIPPVYEPEDPANPDGPKKEVKPPKEIPYPKEDWKTYNDEQKDLRDKMYLDHEALMKKEAEEKEEARKAAESDALDAI